MNGKSSFELVRDWMIKAGQECPPKTLDVFTRWELREALIKEGFEEYLEESSPFASTEYLKELADLLIVVYGAFADLDIDADEVVKIVMDNNTKKLESKVVRPDGKVTTSVEVKKKLKREVEQQLRALLFGD